MKVLFLVITLFTFVTGDEYKIPSLEELSKGIGLYNGEIKDNVLNYKDRKYELGNPDEDDRERPCRIYDRFCIRRFLSQHSNCKESYGPMPDPLYRDQNFAHLARINLTVTATQQDISGINGRIVEFYINKKTDKLLLAVEFNNFGMNSTQNYVTFHRRGREPIVTMGFINVTYASVITTIIIPNLKDLQYEKSEVFTYNTDQTPQFTFGLSAFIASDPIVQETALAFLASFADNIREGHLTDGTYFIGNYIKYNLCDFGIRVV